MRFGGAEGFFCDSTFILKWQLQMEKSLLLFSGFAIVLESSKLALPLHSLSSVSTHREANPQLSAQQRSLEIEVRGNLFLARGFGLVQ